MEKKMDSITNSGNNSIDNRKHNCYSKNFTQKLFFSLPSHFSNFGNYIGYFRNSILLLQTKTS